MRTQTSTVYFYISSSIELTVCSKVLQAVKSASKIIFPVLKLNRIEVQKVTH